jgi:hypothetical protein
MTIDELPERYKYYTLKVSNDEKFTIDGVQKVDIMSSSDQFIEMPNGDIINKSFVVSIVLDAETTRDRFQRDKDHILETMKEVTKHA